MKTAFPRRTEHLEDKVQFVALVDDTSYDSDGSPSNHLSIEVVGDNVEQAAAWAMKRETSAYQQRSYKLYKLVPVTVQKTISIRVDEA